MRSSRAPASRRIGGPWSRNGDPLPLTARETSSPVPVEEGAVKPLSELDVFSVEVLSAPGTVIFGELRPCSRCLPPLCWPFPSVPEIWPTSPFFWRLFSSWSSFYSCWIPLEYPRAGFLFTGPVICDSHKKYIIIRFEIQGKHQSRALLHCTQTCIMRTFL